MKLSFSHHPTHRTSNKRKGFSLVEVIIAIAIVALLLTGFLGVFGSAQKNINRALGVKEANILKDSLETEMSILRSNEALPTGAYGNSFHKAFEMIKKSSLKESAILIYQYKASPIDPDDDGILPAYTGADGIQGKDYITQVAVRTIGLNDDIIEQELSSKTVIGNVYVVRMTQLIKDPATGNIELSEHLGEIWHQVGNDIEKVDRDPGPPILEEHQVYNSAVITFQAEFFRLRSNSYGYISDTSADAWSFENLGNPVAKVNLAIRR